MTSDTITFIHPILLPAQLERGAAPNAAPGSLLELFAKARDFDAFLGDSLFDSLCNAVRTVFPRLLNLCRLIIGSGGGLFDGHARVR